MFWGHLFPAVSERLLPPACPSLASLSCPSPRILGAAPRGLRLQSQWKQRCPGGQFLGSWLCTGVGALGQHQKGYCSSSLPGPCGLGYTQELPTWAPGAHKENPRPAPSLHLDLHTLHTHTSAPGQGALVSAQEPTSGQETSRLSGSSPDLRLSPSTTSGAFLLVLRTWTNSCTSPWTRPLA